MGLKKLLHRCIILIIKSSLVDGLDNACCIVVSRCSELEVALISTFRFPLTIRIVWVEILLYYIVILLYMYIINIKMTLRYSGKKVAKLSNQQYNLIFNSFEFSS